MEILRPDPSRLCNEDLNINVYKILENIGAYDVSSIEYRLRSLQIGYRIFYKNGCSTSQFKDFHHQKSKVKYLNVLIYLFCIGLSVLLWMIDSSYYLFLLPLLGGFLLNRLYFSQRWKANVLHVKEILSDPESLKALMLIPSDDMEGFRLFAKKLFWINLEVVDKDGTLISEVPEIDSSKTTDVSIEPLTFRSIFLNDDLYHVAIEKLSEYFSNDGRFIKNNRGKAYLIAILYALQYQAYLRKRNYTVAEIQEIAASVLGTPVSVETAKFTERVIRGKFDEILRVLPKAL
jgi:hypothetical protein